jgi:hypothetical protein
MVIKNIVWKKSCSGQDTVQNMFLTEIIETGMKVNDRQVSIGYYQYIGVSLILVT